MKKAIFSGMLLGILLLGSCGLNSQNKIDMQNFEQHITTLRGKKVFFGHQSVGQNLMEGLIALNESVDAKLNIQLTRDSSAFITPVFAHDAIGINRDPWSKVNDFCDLMEGELGGMVDIALFKFCYVDLKRKTDIDSLFNHYEKRVAVIQAKHPRLKIVHITTPVKVFPKNWKDKLSVYMGKDHSFYLNKYNRLLRDRYGADGVFDLAKLEATAPNGSVNQKKGNYYLINAYTNDGGHLKPEAARFLAAKLVEKLAAQ